MRLLHGSVHANRSIAYVSQVLSLVWALTCYAYVLEKESYYIPFCLCRSRGYFLEQFVITYYLERIMILRGESVQCSTKLSVSIILWNLFFSSYSFWFNKFHLISIHKLLIHKLVEFNLSRYWDTLWACALDVDISLMAGGDMAHIGERGVNLSGGQRARLAMARSIHLYVLQFKVFYSSNFFFMLLKSHLGFCNSQGSLSWIGYSYAWWCS